MHSHLSSFPSIKIQQNVAINAVAKLDPSLRASISKVEFSRSTSYRVKTSEWSGSKTKGEESGTRVGRRSKETERFQMLWMRRRVLFVSFSFRTSSFGIPLGFILGSGEVFEPVFFLPSSDCSNLSIPDIGGNFRSWYNLRCT